MSWVHVADVTSAFTQAMTNDDWRGIYNVCAPQPATNAEFMGELRGALGRPWCPPAPAWAVRLAARWLMRTEPDLMLKGRRCVPARLREQGFEFAFSELGPALRDLVGK